MPVVKPASRCALADAGMVPALAAMATMLAAAPAAISGAPGTRRLVHRKTPPRPSVAMCVAACNEVLPLGAMLMMSS